MHCRAPFPGPAPPAFVPLPVLLHVFCVFFVWRKMQALESLPWGTASTKHSQALPDYYHVPLVESPNRDGTAALHAITPPLYSR